MSDRISPDEVTQIAVLARLRLTPAEVVTFAAQLGDVLDHAADIAALDLDGVEATSHPFPLANVMREDVAAPSLDRDEVLAAGPLTEEGRFSVPPVLGEGQ